MNHQNPNIEIKQIILTHFQNAGCSVHRIIPEILTGLMEAGTLSSCPETAFLNASEYILAYLQMGFSYMEHQTLFDSVLRNAGWDCESITRLYHQNEPIPLNKSSVRSLIGRWAPSPYNSHTINAAINDILFRVTDGSPGVYQYYTAKKDGTFTALYQLIVNPEYALFHDVFRNKYYRLVKK